MLAAIVLVSCAGTGQERSGDQGTVRNASPSTDATPQGSAPASVEEVMRRAASFRGYPPFHGTLVMHTVEGDVSFEMWVREPEFRVDLEAQGEPVGPWVSDGLTTNIREPHVHAVAFLATDPRVPDHFCANPRFVGTDELLGRPISGVTCLSESGRRTYWIDDQTGMIVRAKERSDDYPRAWVFTELDLNPDFPPGTFEVP